MDFHTTFANYWCLVQQFWFSPNNIRIMLSNNAQTKHVWEKSIKCHSAWHEDPFNITRMTQFINAWTQTLAFFQQYSIRVFSSSKCHKYLHFVNNIRRFYIWLELTRGLFDLLLGTGIFSKNYLKRDDKIIDENFKYNIFLIYLPIVCKWLC